MNTLIIYDYEEQSIVVLLDEDDNIISHDYANGIMWTIENSLIEIFGEQDGELIYNKLTQNQKLHNLKYIEYVIQDDFSFQLILTGLRKE